MPIVRLYNACWAWVVREIDLHEVLLLTAVALLAYGCWLVWRPAAFLVPGLILLWMTMPPRQGFIQRPEPAAPVDRRQT